MAPGDSVVLAVRPAIDRDVDGCVGGEGVLEGTVEVEEEVVVTVKMLGEDDALSKTWCGIIAYM